MGQDVHTSLRMKLPNAQATEAQCPVTTPILSRPASLTADDMPASFPNLPRGPLAETAEPRCACIRYKAPRTCHGLTGYDGWCFLWCIPGALIITHDREIRSGGGGNMDANGAQAHRLVCRMITCVL